MQQARPKGVQEETGLGGKEIHRELCKRLNLTIPQNGIGTAPNPSGRMRRIKFSGKMRYERITNARVLLEN